MYYIHKCSDSPKTSLKYRNTNRIKFEWLQKAWLIQVPLPSQIQNIDCVADDRYDREHVLSIRGTRKPHWYDQEKWDQRYDEYDFGRVEQQGLYVERQSLDPEFGQNYD